MRTVIEKWGRQAAVRLPDSMLRSAHLAVGRQVHTKVRDGVITLRSVERRRHSLEDLIAATPSFDRPSDWLDDRRGREVEDGAS